MITIAIPFYNAESYLESAIKSVLAQTYKEWKLLLLDDGSTDNSLMVAKKYQNNDSRIKVLSDGNNLNLPVRLNQIASITETLYLARMDADDIMHPQRIEQQLKLFELFPEIDVLGTNAYSIDEENNVQGIKIKVMPESTEVQECSAFIHPTIMAKTSWFNENPYDARAIRCEDAELWRRTSKNSVFMFATTPLIYYREYGNNYYRKYFKSLKGKMYIFTKEFKSQRRIDYFFTGFLKTLMVGCAYYVFNIFNKEHILLRSRYSKLDNLYNSNLQH